MILHTVFMMFVDFSKKLVSGGVSRLAQKEKFHAVYAKILHWNFIETSLELHLNFIESF